MKITIVCDVLGQENNGLTIATMNLIRYLKERGHEVKVLCADADKKDLEGHYVVPNKDFGVFDNYLEKNGVSLASPDKEIIESAIKGTDVVHIMLPFALGQAVAKITEEKKIPTSAGFHLLAENFSSHIFMNKSRLVNHLTYEYFHNMFKRVDAIHYITQYVRDLYEGMYGKTNGYVISNGVSDLFKPEHISHDDGYFRILYTGRYSREKSHKVLIRAVAKSRYKNKILLTFAGRGPLEEKLKEEAKVLPVPPVFGFFGREEMPAVDNSADLYVHAAEYEAEGIGCLEALACGVVPVINDAPKSATKFYAIDEKSLFKCNDSDDLAAKIDWWIEHPEIKAEYSEKYARMSDEKFRRSVCMKRMEEMLSETAAIKK